MIQDHRSWDYWEKPRKHDTAVFSGPKLVYDGFRERVKEFGSQIVHFSGLERKRTI